MQPIKSSTAGENPVRVMPRVTLLVTFLLLLTSIRPVAGETPAAALDPVVVEVIEMLGAGVDEGVIAQWIRSTGRRPEDIGSQGVIALTEAGASEQLINSLLTRIEVGGDARSPVEPPSSSSIGQEAPVESSGAAVEATIQLRAKQVWVDEDEPDRPRDPPWDIYLYLDGDFVAWTRPTLQGAPVDARRVIEPGSHELRVVLQRYQEMRGGWLHESLVVPTVLQFDARSEGALEIEIELKRIWGLWRQRKDGGPLSYVVRQGGEVLTENRGTGGDPNRWSPVCEDVEANFSDRDEVPKRFRDAMNRCIRWVEMWTGVGNAPSRTEILKRLAESDFQPPVR